VTAASYAAAVASGRCPRCRGVMLEEWTTVHCPTCLDAVAASDRERRARPGHYARRYAARVATTAVTLTCLECPAPREPGSIRCRDHVVANSTASMDRYDALKADGLCPKCGGARESARAWCAACRAKRAERERAREARAA
jgi:Zn finger protein HypA/HybF involved in hydrogenase expression